MTIFQKRHSPRTSFNSETGLDTVLDKTSFQGYRQFKLVYSLAHNIPRPLKESRSFKAFSSTFFSNHANPNRLATLGLLRQSNKGGACLTRDAEVLELNVFNQLLSLHIMGLLGPKAI